MSTKSNNENQIFIQLKEKYSIDNGFNIRVYNEESGYEILNNSKDVIGIYLNSSDMKVINFIVESLLEQNQENKKLYLSKNTYNKININHLIDLGVNIEFI